MSHHIGISATYTAGGRAWQAVCACGWKSEPRLSLKNAQQLGDQHAAQNKPPGHA